MKSVHQKSDPELIKLYRYYRRKFFDNKLPPARDIYIAYDKISGNDEAEVWDEENDYHHEHHLLEDSQEYAVLINWKLKKNYCLKRIAILHEMAHISVWEMKNKSFKCSKSYSGHGKIWKAEILRLMNAGAYNTLL